jgi:segregation and condensation protein B
LIEGKEMENFDIKPVLEGLIFVSESPLKLETLVEILPELGKEAILDGILRIQTEYAEDSKGMELVEVGGGYQFRTKPQWAEWIQRLKKAKPVKLSRSALETLAIVAYRQPVIRPAIEQIRGVDSGWVLRTLLEKGLIKITGRKEIPGRPIVYGTTKAFLELFSLNSLSDLPAPKEIQPPPMAEEIPEEIAKEEIAEGEILRVEDKGEVRNGIEEKVEAASEAESNDQVESQVFDEISPTGELKE